MHILIASTTNVNDERDSHVQTVTANGEELTYDIHGPAHAPTLLLLSGWCQDHRLFDHLLAPLARHHRVVRLNWRGHSDPRQPSADFGVDEQAGDIVSALDELEIDQVVPISTSHGGWANIEASERLGVGRVPRTIVIDWILTEAGPEFIHNLQEIQDPKQWAEGRERLFAHWRGVSTDPVVNEHLEQEMATFGYQMWERSCRIIEQGYRTWGSPLSRMAAMQPARPISHIYSQSPERGYEDAQRAFATEHPWFTFHKIPGLTHFPTLESPKMVAEHIENSLQTSD